MKRAPLAFIVAAALLAIPSGASATERVVDGGFDQAACNTSDCTSPVWHEFDTPAPFKQPAIGPICNGMTAGCADYSGSGYHTPPHWASVARYYNTENGVSAIEQTVSIPQAPARLAFYLRIYADSSNNMGNLRVTIGGATVFSATSQTLGYASYAPVVIDASAFAGGPRTLRFEGEKLTTFVGSNNYFDIDTVSLDAAGVSLASLGAAAGGCAGATLASQIFGTEGNDVLTGTPGRDVILGLGGKDKVTGLGGNDVICGGPGKDTLKGGPGKDRLYGQGASDRLIGGGSKDKCVGGKANDTAKSCEKEKSI